MSAKPICRAVTVIFVCLLSPLIIYAQDQRERVIEKLFVPYPASRGGPLLSEPLEFVNLKVEGKSVEPGVPFLAGEDWLKGLTITLKNISGKPIVGIDVNVEIPIIDTNLRRVALVSLTYGSNLLPLKLRDKKNTAKPIGDGQSVTLVLTDGIYSGMQQTRAEGGGVPGFDLVRIYLLTAIYDDDTAWAEGLIVRRDADDSGRWSVVRPEVDSNQ